MPHINASIFKAYDIRGRYPTELNEGSAYLSGRGFAHLVKARRVVAGYDCRLSSEPLFNSFVRGLTEEGVEVHTLGLASTPYVYFAANQADYDGACNVTASHNPPEYNGFKLTRARGVPISSETGLREILKLAQDGLPVRRGSSGQVLRKDFTSTYLDAITRGRVIGNLKIALDTGNGMAGLLDTTIIARLSQNQIVTPFF